jgi:hypothetical protein
MKLHVLFGLVALFALSAFAQSKTGSPPAIQPTDFQARIEASQAQAQSEIRAIEHQMETASPAERDILGRKITAVKLDAEIARLQILLDWARTENDAARVAKLEQALDQSKTPPQTRKLSEHPKTERAASNAGQKNVPVSK